jgi:hypothetical protein
MQSGSWMRFKTPKKTSKCECSKAFWIGIEIQLHNLGLILSAKVNELFWIAFDVKSNNHMLALIRLNVSNDTFR